MVTSLCPFILFMLSNNYPYFGLSGACCQSALESIHGLRSNMMWLLSGWIQSVVQRNSTVFHVPGRMWRHIDLSLPTYFFFFLYRVPNKFRNIALGSLFQMLPSFRNSFTRKHWKTMEFLEIRKKQSNHFYILPISYKLFYVFKSVHLKVNTHKMRVLQRKVCLS